MNVADIRRRFLRARRRRLLIACSYDRHQVRAVERLLKDRGCW